MKILLKILIAGMLVWITFCASIRLPPHEDTKSFTPTTIELLSSFENCIVYIFDWAYLSDYDSLASTKYVRFYSEYINCAVFIETYCQYQNCTFNERFNKLEPKPVFTKYTTTLLNLYTPDTTSTILNKVEPIERFYYVILYYNIPFNYILIFMRNEEFWSIDNVGLFCKLATNSAPAIYILILAEKEVNVIGFAHAFQSAPFLFRVTNFKEVYIRQLHEVIHKDMQAAISRIRSIHRSWEQCTFGAAALSHPHLCALDVISKNLNITFVTEEDHPEPNLSISEIIVTNILNAYLISHMSRGQVYNMDFVSYAMDYEEHTFLCITHLNTIGLMAFVQAYDLLTWIVAATACLGLSLTIAAMATKTTVSFWAKWQSSAPVVLMLLIERFYGYGQVIRSASKQMVLVITLWAFGAMLLGICYSGNMISNLTSPPLPSCPHDMQQLSVIDQYPILTDLVIQKSVGYAPTFHDEIDAYLMEYADENGSLLPVLRQFGKVLTFVNDNSTQLIPSNHETSSKILFAYVATTYGVRAYGMWSITDSSSIRVLYGGSLPFFNVWAPIAVQSNFLAPVFQRILGNICGNGMWKHWKDSRDAMIVHELLKFFGKRMERESEIELVRKSNLAAIWRNFNPLVAGETPWSAMTLESLTAAFQLFVISMFLALCVFSGERRLLQIILYHLLQLVKKASSVLNRITDTFWKLITMLTTSRVPAATVQPKP